MAKTVALKLTLKKNVDDMGNMRRFDVLQFIVEF